MRIDPPVSVPIDAHPIPAATAAAEPPLEPPGDRLWIVRIAHRSKRRFVARRAEREFVEVGLADDDRAGLAQTGHDWRVGSGDVPGSHSRRGCRRTAFDVDQILDGNRPAVQRTARSTLAQLLVEQLAPAPSPRLEDRDEGIERRVQLGDALERVGDTVSRRGLSVR